MTLDAVALLDVEFEQLKNNLELAEELEGSSTVLLFRSSVGTEFGAEDLRGAAAIHTGLPLSTPVADIALRVRHLLGEILDAHRDPRGLLIYPAVAKPAPGSFSEVAEQVGEGGEWTPVPPLDQVPSQFENALPGGLGELMGQVMQMMGPEVGRLAQAAMSGDTGALEQAASGMQARLEASGQADDLQDAFGEFMGGGLPDLSGKEGGMDLSKIMEQATAIAQSNPDLVESIRGELSGSAEAPVDGADLKEMLEKATEGEALE